jgi:hypothetical protein
MVDLLPTAHRQIGARTFFISALPTVPGRRLFFKLMKICGPACVSFLRSLDGTEKVEELDVAVLADAAEELIRNLSEADFEDFYTTFEGSTQVSTPEGGQVPLSTLKARAFSADYGSMVKWMSFSLEFNFSSFLADLGLTAPRG